MRRREVLKRAGAASTITLAALAGTSTASSLPGDGDRFVTQIDDGKYLAEIDGEPVVVENLEGDDDVTTTAYCPHYCNVDNCDDCADNCDEYCDGCLCP